VSHGAPEHARVESTSRRCADVPPDADLRCSADPRNRVDVNCVVSSEPSARSGNVRRTAFGPRTPRGGLAHVLTNA
jgi:hypothetical protein